MSEEKLTNTQVAELGLSDWRALPGPLYTRYRTGDFATGLRLVDAVGAAAEELNHHPDVDLRYASVQIRLWSHDVGGKTARDVELARRISAAAAELGVVTELDRLTMIDPGLDTWDSAEILPFWLALYGLTDATQGEVIDPDNYIPGIWFQHTDEHATPRQRWHPDVWVPLEHAQARIDAAVAAGGTIVDDSHGLRYVVLADPQGNRACVCTVEGR